MKIEKIGEPKVIMSNPGSVHNYFAWPSVTRLQNGKLAVVASGFRLGHVCPFGKLVISYSENEGETYTAPAPIIDTVLDDRDGGIATFGTDGVIVTSFNNKVQMQKDNLKQREKLNYEVENIPYCQNYLDMISEEAEQAALGSEYRISTDGGVTFGPIYRSPVTSPHGPIELQDGTVLWVGRTFNEDSTVDGEEEGVKAYKINLDGTMERLGEIKEPRDEQGALLGQFHEPYAFQLEVGTILCHLRIEPTFTTYQSESYDGGKTWTKAYPLLPDRGGAPAHIMEHSSGVLISVYGYRTPPKGGIRVMFSTDGGKTWDVDHILYENELNPVDLGYPATVELDDVTLLTVFYAHEDDGKSYNDPGQGPTVIWQQKWRIVE